MENILELVAVHGSQVETVLQDVEKTDMKQMKKKKTKTQYICGSGCVLVLRYFFFRIRKICFSRFISIRNSHTDFSLYSYYLSLIFLPMLYLSRPF